jgi:hypothetical protein
MYTDKMPIELFCLHLESSIQHLSVRINEILSFSETPNIQDSLQKQLLARMSDLTETKRLLQSVLFRTLTGELKWQ